MGRKKKFIENLSTEEQTALERGHKYGSGPDFRQRCKGILLSNKGYDVDQISAILECSKLAVYQWMQKWEDGGISSLERQPGQGRKSKLLLKESEHVEVVKAATKKHPQNSSAILEEVKAALAIEELSKKSLTRFLKSLVIDGSDSDEGSNKSQHPKK